MSQIASTQRARFIPVFLGVFVLVATVALKLDVVGSKAALSKAEVVSTTMHAAVHQNNDIFLTFDDGSAVGNQDRNTPTIPAGTYTIRVVDDTTEHNFHLVGPGVDMSTDTTNTSSPTWTVTFQNGGTYRFVCDNHPDFMFGVFQASGSASGGSSGGSSSGGSSSGGSSSGGSSSGGTSSGGSSSGRTKAGSGGTSGGTAVLGTLAGTVSPSGKLTLLYKGKAVSKLKSGRYKITVTDKAPARSFMVQQIKKGPITVSGVSFVGSHTVTVSLGAGKWTFYTSAGPRYTGSFTVS